MSSSSPDYVQHVAVPPVHHLEVRNLHDVEGRHSLDISSQKCLSRSRQPHPIPVYLWPLEGVLSSVLIRPDRRLLGGGTAESHTQKKLGKNYQTTDITKLRPVQIGNCQQNYKSE